jgi:hypothetical protein
MREILGEQASSTHHFWIFPVIKKKEQQKKTKGG